MEVLQRKVAQEDTVQYKLFLVQISDTCQVEKLLANLIKEILGKFATLLARYIWHHQPFNLKLYPEKGDIPAHLGGSTQFTDNVEDEWFIVYLLQQITEAFPELAARVEDNDGEFLLIEAADYLPKWLNPDTSENRVFIYRGDLYMIPCHTPSNTVGIPKDEVPSLAQALSLLSSNPEACHPSSKISAAVRRRLKGYPERIQTELHHAHCFIPAGIALILAERPDLVAPAVSAFYLRDPVDLQACRSFKTFPPDTRILAMVTFTRCLFAQLQQQQFTPDRRSGYALPPRSDPKYKAHELGMKLAHGFEILCSKARMPSSDPNAPVSCNPQWKGFIECLKRNGYFRGEIEGSTLFKDLLYRAENFFKQSVYSEFNALSPGDEVLKMLQSLPPFSLEELKEKESQLPPEDSDSWLDITEQDLEQMLQERAKDCDAVEFQKSSVSYSKDEPVDSQVNENAGYSLVAVSQGMKNFLNAISSHEGAELPRLSQPFSFDPNSMVSALDRLLGGSEEGELDSDDLDDDDNDGGEDEREFSVPSEMNGPETLDSLKKYMDQMDEELLGTNIGQSFNQNHKTDPQSGSSISSGEGSLNRNEGVEETEEDIQPLDIDLNLVTNLLESLSSQAGLAGPASNLLQSLGIHLPPNSDPS
ncbi:protein ecdysoneless homolog [Boleophthalmus pectinirostris]|uniref:protein ecdysoneless homolog n=1 Tax=Boleophthalmus pectinirostris TaxID=150288 RepID=UPI000A1C5E75|nr:protein ecdysoneless homolog [Boleophthalmus pectinirostris]